MLFWKGLCWPACRQAASEAVAPRPALQNCQLLPNCHIWQHLTPEHRETLVAPVNKEPGQRWEWPKLQGARSSSSLGMEQIKSPLQSLQVLSSWEQLLCSEIAKEKHKVVFHRNRTRRILSGLEAGCWSQAKLCTNQHPVQRSRDTFLKSPHCRGNPPSHPKGLVSSVSHLAFWALLWPSRAGAGTAACVWPGARELPKSSSGSCECAQPVLSTKCCSWNGLTHAEPDL